MRPVLVALGVALWSSGVPATLGAQVLPVLAIHQIQGADARSPWVDQFVETRGVVTGATANGFFLQTADHEVDGDVAASEGLFVFTSQAPPSAAARGALVQRSGRARSPVPSADPASPPLTELVAPQVFSLGMAPLPAPVTVGAEHLRADGPRGQLEHLEGMRIRVDALRVVAPTGGRVDEVSGRSASDGVLLG